MHRVARHVPAAGRASVLKPSGGEQIRDTTGTVGSVD